MKRFLAMLLCLVMVVGLVPATVFAADVSAPIDTAIFFSDLHTTSSNYKKSILKGVMSAVKGLPVSSVTSCGDAFSVNSGSGYTGKTSTLTKAIVSGLEKTVPVNYVWSDHDRCAVGADDKTLLDNDSGFIYGAGADGIYGNADDGNYYIYELSMADLSTNNRYYADFHADAEVTATIAAFVEDAKKLDQTKPLFIAGHQPLLDRRDDNGHAYEWATAINEVAEEMDVAYFFGHNHKYDVDGDYYYAKGDTMSVCSSSSGSANNVKLNFTHLCAGYLDPSTTGSTSSTTRQGTIVAAVIYDDKVELKTYKSSGEYLSGSYALNKTMNRDFAASEPEVTLSSIAISGKTEYRIGEELDLTVTATYSEGEPVDVTAEAELSGYNKELGGKQIVTAKFGGKEATIEVTVNPMTVTAWDDKEMISVSATADNISGITVTNVYGNPDLSKTFSDYMSVSVAVEGVSAGTEVSYAMEVLTEIPVDGLVLYHVAEDGTLTPVNYTLTTSESGGNYLNFSTTLTGIFAYGKVTVPAGYVLSGLTLENQGKVNYLVGESLDMTALTVTAVYTKDGAENFTRLLSIKDDYATFDGYTFGMPDMTTAGKKTVPVSYGDITESFEIEVFNKDFVHAETGISAQVTVPGATAIDAKVSANENVAVAIADVIKGDKYAAYDIELAGYNDGETVSVTLPIPAGVENPAVYYVSDDGSKVDPMTITGKTDTTVTFETDHFSTYVVGNSSALTGTESDQFIPGNSTTTTEEKTVYVKVDAPVNGEEYLIVSTGAAGTAGYILGGSSVTPVSGTLTVDGTDGTYTYIESTGTLWTASGSGSSWSFAKGSNHLGYTQNPSSEWYGTSYSYSLNQSATSAVTWTLGSNALSVNLITSDSFFGDSNDDFYLTGGSSWSMDTTAANVYFYKEVTATVTTTTGTADTTYHMDITLDGTATKEITAAFIKSGDTLQLGAAFTPSQPTGGSWTITSSNESVATVDDEVNIGRVTFTGTEGETLIQATYTWTENGNTYTVSNYTSIDVTAAIYSIDITDSTGASITDIVPIKGETDMANGYELDAKLYLQTSETQTEETTLDSTKLTWTSNNTAVATVVANGKVTFVGGEGNVQITAAYTRPNGTIATDVVEFSVSKSAYVTPGDGTDDFPEYPKEGAVRFDKTATAVGNYSETGIAKVELSMTGVPYVTGNRLDVVLMLDRSSSMDKASVDRIGFTVAATKAFVKNIVINEDGTFNDNRIIVMDFLGGNVAHGSQHKYEANLYTKEEESGYEIISSQAELDALFKRIDDGFKGQQSLYGTEYAKGLKDCYDALDKSKADGNKQFCVFMSDGIPNYFQGETTLYESTSSIIQMFTTRNTSSTNPTVSRSTTAYQYEKYSTMMKEAGVTVFTVGLGLLGTNSSWSNASEEACEKVANILLNDISGPAGETAAQRDTGTATTKLDKYFFSVADTAGAAGMENVFGNIAQKILEAATDVRVEDKIGNKYTINFGMPKNVDATMTGMSEFYIQAVEYQLDANKERTGNPTILENFTFNSNGTFKSHTVDGVACSNCSHVTTTNGTITAIDGTYFDYSSVTKTDEKGKPYTEEFLNWNNEKIGSTELALQYFAYLDHSADAVGTAEEVPAGTYYTNEYATLTYKNYKGNEVQQKFPVPQMTWNGAQVSYVFYLVNDAGQPVNRAGRVVPFAEAVYVTDVFTHAVVWNDLEQSAGLEAKYLADERVPEVYALYDDDAAYQIHVYKDEDEVNLNNHFVIEGDVGDKYNTETNSWTNPNTTFVFNNKSDSTKYYTAGAYVADDGDGSENEKNLRYLCKGDGTVSGVSFNTFEGLTESAFNENAANGVVYYKLVDGKHVRALQWEAETTYYVLSAASYTAVAGEIQWKPGDKSHSGGTKIGDYVYYVDENGDVYTIVQKSNGTEVHKGFDFSNTTVAFAVVWKPRLETDTVVIDYGLDVVVNVSANDNLASGVVGVRADAPKDVDINKGEYNSATKAKSADIYIDTGSDGNKELKIGTASVENMTSVRFSLDKKNGMQMNKPAVFYYESDCNYYQGADLKTTSMYSSVIVIPATTVYYEDEYVDLASYTLTETQYDENGKVAKDENGNLLIGTKKKDTTSAWTTAGNALNATQAVDRPGFDMISKAYDANNAYGYDAAYSTMSEYSMGSAAKITVSSKKTGEASFTFYGTGFDIIGLTSNTTGTLMIDVYAGATATGTPTTYLVDTYYGYTLSKTDVNEDGKLNDWVISENTPNTLYQVPVMKVSGLTYGQYTVVLTASYGKAFDHKDTGSYDLYLDAIRIYDPVAAGTIVGTDAEENGNPVSIETIYSKDNEGWPVYEELRNNVINASDYNITTSTDEEGNVVVTIVDDDMDDVIKGAVFIDSENENYNISDYVSYGPNNELYLAKNQAIAFNVAVDASVADVQLGIKVANGDTVTYEINGDSYTTNSATDLYYSILKYAKAGTVTIENVGGGILSLTNIKVTHTSAPVSGASLLSIDGESAGRALMMLRRAPAAEEEVPETTVPEETVPETTVPEETAPETTVPEETVPETTVPEETAPEEDATETITNAVENVVNKIKNALSNLFGRWFR